MFYLRVDGRQIRLTGNFDDKAVTETAVVIGAVAQVPMVGSFVNGISVVFPMGGQVGGFIYKDVLLAIAETTAAPMQINAPARPVATPAGQ